MSCLKGYSQDTRDDIQANYKGNLLNYSKLKEETKRRKYLKEYS